MTKTKKKNRCEFVPLGSGPGIFGCYGTKIRVIGFGRGRPGIMGFEFAAKTKKRASATVKLLRQQLMTNAPEAKALREKNSYDNAMRFVLAVLAPAKNRTDAGTAPRGKTAMTVLTDMARKHVLTSDGMWLMLPVANDPCVARFSSIQDAEVSRRILLGMGIWVQIAAEESLPFIEGSDAEDTFDSEIEPGAAARTSPGRP
jgi:hypothetical protein